MKKLLGDFFPDIAKEWHPTKNKGLTPNEVTSGSNKRVWWICQKGHSYDSIVANRTKGNCCPFCSGQKACEDNCLATVNPELAKEWHPTKNEGLTPNDVTSGSSRKRVWWKCKKGHSYDCVVASRTKGNGCPFCSGKKVCEDNCLATVNPELAKEWHPTKNEELTPKLVTASSSKRVWWICQKGHSYDSIVANRTKG